MNQLTSEQRYEIYLGRKRGWSRSRIAREIGVHPSTVSRELQRNCNSNGEYVWCNAQAKADARRHGLQGNHRKPPELWWRIELMIMEEDWSPAQIAGGADSRQTAVPLPQDVENNHNRQWMRVCGAS